MSRWLLTSEDPLSYEQYYRNFLQGRPRLLLPRIARAGFRIFAR